jgi:hypothetical protein
VARRNASPGDEVSGLGTTIRLANALFVRDVDRHLTGHRIEVRGCVRNEHVGVERTREQRVVDSPQHVAFRIATRENCFGDEFSCVSREHDLDVDAGGRGEGIKDSIRIGK